MLHSITSDLPTFHPIEFKPGVNLVVAEGEWKKQGGGSANSVGKSSVFLLIDYLLGGEYQESAFPSALFENVSFTLDATIGGNRVRVTRSMKKELRRTILIRGSVEGWPAFKDDISQAEDVQEISLAEWRVILGKLCFGLPDCVEGDYAREAKPPSARDLFTCFNRKGFADVVRAFPHQGKEKGNFLYVYLMNLNWTYLATLIGLKKEESVIKSIDATIKFEKALNNLGSDETGKRMEKIQSDIGEIERSMERGMTGTLFESSIAQVDDLTIELRAAQRRVSNAQRRIAMAEDSLRGIEDDVDALVAFYREANVDLGDAVVRKLEEVRQFHQDIRTYRAEILNKEIIDNRKELAAARRQVARLDAQRAALMSSPEVKNTLGDFQENHKKLAALYQQVSEARQVEKLITDKREEANRLCCVKDELVKSESDKFYKNRHLVDEFRGRFCSLVEKLYANRPVEPRFDVQFLSGESSKGKRGQYAINIEAHLKGDYGPGMAHMKVCAFDFVLFEMNRRFGRGIDFLLHDSPAFESTDTAQLARLLIHAERMTEETTSQYLCAIDSDRLKIATEKVGELEWVLMRANQIHLSQTNKLFGFDY